MLNNNPSVCFFDSGIGGLNLLYECVRKLPCVDFTYFADNFRVPYGNFSQEELIEIADKIFSEISNLNPAAAVVACNTVTAQCIDFLRKKYPFDIIGIQPAIKPAVQNDGKCLVLATPSTANSEAFKNLVAKYGGGRTKVVACPDLAAYIENNIENLSRQKVQSLLPDENADSVVLGCTHYIFVKEAVEKYYNCPVYDGIEGTTARLIEKLGICDHRVKRAQTITFSGGDCIKNRRIFHELLRRSGSVSLK